MDFNNSDESMWGWQCQEYDLGDDTTFDMSKSMLNEGPTDDFACMFGGETTPFKACGDISYHVNDTENIKGLGQCKDVHVQTKRRRMLRFESEELESTPGIEDIPSSSFLQENESQNFMEEGISEISQWVSGFADGTSTSTRDVLDESFEGWFSDCLNDSQMELCSDNTNRNPSDVADVHTDIAEQCNIPPGKYTVQATSVRILGNMAYKGRKSCKQNPVKVASASAVVYPFAFVKPCGVEGEVTLKDINNRIGKPVSKLTQKKEDPLADYPKSAISGKPVVGKTKIHTVGGKGSITIMRTKG